MLLTFEEGETERRERTEGMPPLCGCRGCTDGTSITSRTGVPASRSGRRRFVAAAVQSLNPSTAWSHSFPY